MEQCRDSGLSYHVDYATDEDGRETENLSHRESILFGEIEERGDLECGWIVEDDGERIRLLISTDTEGGFDIDHQITADTAEQLADMFSKIAVQARNQIKEAQANREALEREAAEIASRQIDLFAKTTIN